LAEVQWEKLVARLEGVLDHVDDLLERVAPAPDPHHEDFAPVWPGSSSTT
jgi:hypothetical protein